MRFVGVVIPHCLPTLSLGTGAYSLADIASVAAPRTLP
jgi:hypothetical protein